LGYSCADVETALETQIPTDEELLERARRGDPHALDLFVRRMTPVVHRWMARAVGQQDADDMTQEVLLRACRGLARYRGDASPRAWLAAIADNAVKNRYRFLGRFRRVFSALKDPHWIPDPPDPGADPEAVAGTDETRRMISEALEGLSEEYRMPVILRDLEQWSYEEIASSLNLPVGTVKSRIARGRGQLRDRLAPLLRRGAPK
jgi:RNA polymerase sigma-70 factor, ECF subfamily